jgi:hypothetical protein
MFLKGMRQTLPGWNLEGTATLQLKHVKKHGKNTGVLSLSLNLSRFIRIYLEFIRMHLDIQFYPDFPDFPRFILSKIHGSVPVLDHDNSSKRRHTEGHQMAKRTMSIASLPQHFE